MSEANDPEPVDAEFEPADDSGERDPPRKRGGIAPFIIIFLTAVIIGGTGGAWLFWQYGPQQTTTVDLEPLETRLAALESTERPAPFDPTELTARIDALEGTESSALSDPTIPIRLIALEASLTRLEEQLATFDESERGNTGGGTEALTALEARISALESSSQDEGDAIDTSALEARISSLESMPEETGFDPSALEARIAAIETAETPQPDFSTLEARIAGLETALAETRNMQADQDGDSRELAARSLALVALAEAAGTSRSFEAERAALARLWRNQPTLAALANHARSGVPTPEALAQGYPREDIENAIGTNRVFFGLIEVRPSQGSDASPLAIVALADEELADGNLQAATQLTEQLDGQALAAAQAWLVQARARLSVDAALSDLRTALTENAAQQGADPT